jgi:hypothetical protein
MNESLPACGETFSIRPVIYANYLAPCCSAGSITTMSLYSKVTQSNIFAAFYIFANYYFLRINKATFCEYFSNHLNTDCSALTTLINPPGDRPQVPNVALVFVANPFVECFLLYFYVEHLCFFFCKLNILPRFLPQNVRRSVHRTTLAHLRHICVKATPH